MMQHYMMLRPSLIRGQVISIKATINGDIATLTIIRQKNDEEGRALTFQKQPLGGKGRLVMVPHDAAVAKASQLSGQNMLAYDALVRAVDDGHQAEPKARNSSTPGNSPPVIAASS